MVDHVILWVRYHRFFCYGAIAIIFFLSRAIQSYAYSLATSPTATIRDTLQIPSAGPSLEYLATNRRISSRIVDWCEGSILPLQRYHAGSSRFTSSQKLRSPPSNAPSEAAAALSLPVVGNEESSEVFLQNVSKDPESFDLSKTSLSMLQDWQSLTKIQKDQLAQKIRVEQQATQQITLEALEILYCDAHICVANKPSGVLSVPGPRRNPSLANLVYNILQPPGIDLDQMVVHRLDMATSGIIVYALSLEALSKLHADFKHRRVQKTYQALVSHQDSSILSSLSTVEGEIDVELERDPNNAPFMRIAQSKESPSILATATATTTSSSNVENDGEWGKIGTTHKFYTTAPKPSLTTWTLLGREVFHGKAVSRLELRPWTGRTHQLRVHCAQVLGAPIVGDDIYGSGHDGEKEAEVDDTPLCLHARQLCIHHPISGAPMIFEADPPF